MKKILYLLCIPGCFASCIPNHKEAKQLEEFYSVFNQEQKEAFELAIISFDQFLERNFSEGQTPEKKLLQFLEEVKDPAKYKRWEFGRVEAGEVLLKFEESGLRKEIWLYDFEKDSEIYEVIQLTEKGGVVVNETDSLKFFNIWGNYLQGLLNIRNPSQFVTDYAEAKYIAGFMSTSLMAEGILASLDKTTGNQSILKRILVAEFYFDLLQMHVLK